TRPHQTRALQQKQEWTTRRHPRSPSYTKPRGDRRLTHIGREGDSFSKTAGVRVDASTRIDYMHMAKRNGRWVIVNVLW
ncbi:MAG: nuclear transport factor 2 family protein, partial [Gemmatimonadaceae bacterium]